MNSQLQLAQHYYANVLCEAVTVSRLVQLTPLIDHNNTIQQSDKSVYLLTQPVVYQTNDGQYEVLNARLVLAATDHYRLHPKSKVQVFRLLDESALTMAHLYYQRMEVARQFGDIIPLITAAFAQSHLTSMLNQHILLQHPSRPITTDQIVRLSGSRVGKSTVNKLKKDHHYTDPTRGCQARNVASNDDQERPRYGGQKG